MTPPLSEEPRDYPNRKPLQQQPHWVQDFPADVPDDDHVARREFVKFLVLTSGAFVAGQCWIAAASALRKEGPTPRKQVATVAELESRKVVEFRYPDEHEPCLALCLAPAGTSPTARNALTSPARWSLTSIRESCTAPAITASSRSTREGRSPVLRGGHCRSYGWRWKAGLCMPPGSSRGLSEQGES